MVRDATDWEGEANPARWPLAASLLLPLVALWTLPQTLVGLVFFAGWRRPHGHRLHHYRFGPFRYGVVRTEGPGTAGISLGVVVFARSPDILKHEFCHLLTGLWLGWLYLPVYGLEYLLVGHDRSPHERITCWLERRVPWAWRVM